MTQSLQFSTSDVNTAVNVINFLRSLKLRDQSISSPIRDVVKKWIDKNDVVTAILDEGSPFFDYVQCKNEITEGSATDDRSYLPASSSFSEFCKNASKTCSSFNIRSAIENLKPASVDPERLFSTGPVTKTYCKIEWNRKYTPV